LQICACNDELHKAKQRFTRSLESKKALFVIYIFIAIVIFSFKTILFYCTKKIIYIHQEMSPLVFHFLS